MGGIYQIDENTDSEDEIIKTNNPTSQDHKRKITFQPVTPDDKIKAIKHNHPSKRRKLNNELDSMDEVIEIMEKV